MPLGGGLTVGTALVSAGLGVAKAISAGKDKKRAQAEMAGLKDPFYKIQDEYIQNRNIAAAQAGQGLGSSTRDYLTTESQRGLSSALDNVTNPNAVGTSLDSYFRSLKGTSAQDVAEQRKNIDTFMNVNKDLAGQKVMQFVLNEKQPYENKLKQLQQRIGAADQNKWSGMSEAVAGLGSTGTSLMNSNLFNRVYPTNQTSTFGGSLPTTSTVTPNSSVYNPNTVVDRTLPYSNNSAPSMPLPNNMVPSSGAATQPVTDFSNFDWTNY